MEDTKQAIMSETTTRLEVPGFKVRVTGREEWKQIGIYKDEGGVVPGTQVMFYDSATKRARSTGAIASLFDETIQKFNREHGSNSSAPYKLGGPGFGQPENQNAIHHPPTGWADVTVGTSDVTMSLNIDGTFDLTIARRGVAPKDLLDCLASLKQSSAF